MVYSLINSCGATLQDTPSYVGLQHGINLTLLCFEFRVACKHIQGNFKNVSVWPRLAPKTRGAKCL